MVNLALAQAEGRLFSAETFVVMGGLRKLLRNETKDKGRNGEFYNREVVRALDEISTFKNADNMCSII